MGGVNLVAGFRPKLWQSLVPHGMPSGLEGFNTGAYYFVPSIESLLDVSS